MRFTHHHQFDGLEEIALVIDYDYEPSEPMITDPDAAGFGPGCAENAVVSQVSFNINGRFTVITGLIDDDLMEVLVEASLEDFGSRHDEY